MVELASSTRIAFGLQEGSTATDLLTHFETLSHDPLDGLLTSSEERQTVLGNLGELKNYSIHILEQNLTLQERFCLVNFANHSNPIFVGLLPTTPSNQLPSDLEKLVFWTILSKWQNNWNGRNGEVTSSWRNLASGKAILAIPNEIDLTASLRLVKSLFSLRNEGSTRSQLVSEIARDSNSITFTHHPEDYAELQTNLLGEAALAAHPKWRCLSLYRILENAYLKNIKQKLIDDFEKDASSAVDTARESLSSEMRQLVALAAAKNLAGEFESFDDAYTAQLKGNNIFINALDHAAASDPLYRSPQRFQKGVLRLYKLRCAIAHAGTSGVIYEKFADADQAVLSMLPAIETLALKSMGINAA